jgi:glycosyltransferase involved in cell wall biosynthesis
MKLLVFAHIPPPHHGQSYMVKLLLDGLGGDARRRGKAGPQTSKPKIECYHVNCRYSDDLEDIGSFRLEKTWLLLRYCLEAIGCRFRYGVRTFYYVPAPGKRAALYRDWVVMLLCRPFFRRFIHHWHAVGLGDWLEREGTWFERWLTHRLLGRCSLGIALAIPSMRDALWFRSRHVEIVPNGIPDPCPDFEATVLPRRQARLAARRQLLAGTQPTAEDRASCGDPAVFEVLYLAHCAREKGLFDALDGVAVANERLRATGSPLRIRLTVAGVFPCDEEEAEFRTRIAQPDVAGQVVHAGFVGDAPKRALLLASDALCFPTYYHAESFGLVVIEAMAAGMNVITTRWRALPDLLPADFPGFVPLRDPTAVAEALIAALVRDGTALRTEFNARFTEARHLAALSKALELPIPGPVST